jgi:type I restriction enzyme R subunit
VKVLGDETLRTIAQELVKTVRANVTIDWTLRENVRAQLRVLVKRILRRYGYPPDKQEKATATVLEQAALLSAEWAERWIPALTGMTAVGYRYLHLWKSP